MAPTRDLLQMALRAIGQFVLTSDRVVLPKIIIAEAGTFPELVRFYRTEIIDKGLAVLGRIVARGMARGEFRDVPPEHVARLCIAPVLLTAFWRTTFAQFDDRALRLSGADRHPCRRSAARALRELRNPIMKRIALVFLLVLTGCGQSGPKPWLGYAEGEDAFISAPQPGWVASLAVKRGDVVKQGDVLFTLDDTQQVALRDEARAALAQAKAQYAQTQAQLAYATKDLSRQRKLVHASAGTKAALDAAQNNYQAASAQIEQIKAQERQAKATLDNAEYQLSQRKVVARVGGRIEDIYFRQGEYVPASTPVISLLPPENVFVRFFVPENEFSAAKMGQSVRISCDGCAKDLTATITFIAQQEEFTPPVIFSIANREKLVFKLEARAKGGLPLNPGQPVDVTPIP